MQPRKNSDIPQAPSLFDYFSDLRVIRATAQIIFALIIVFSVVFLWNSVYTQLVAINATPNFNFLEDRAGFAINQSPDWYSANSTYGEAFIVGVINTIQVVWLGLVLATLIGVILGVFLLSQNWLIRTISRIYVEILRNTPLLVQLIFWYFVFWLGLPNTNLSFPNESVMIVALRYFVYLFIIIGAGIYVWRFTAPSRFFNGVLTGFIIAEAAIWLLNDSYIILFIVAAIGAGLLLVANRATIIPKGYEGLAQGAGVLLIATLVGHGLLDVLGGAGILDNARVVYGDVLPLMVVGPNLFATPNFALTPNFLVFSVITVVAIVVAIGLFIYWGGVIERTGANIPRLVYAVTIIVVAGLIGWFIASGPISDDLMITIGEGEDEQTVTLAQARADGLLAENELEVYDSGAPIVVQPPQLNRFGTRVEVGNNISPNYVTLLIGLVIYTSAFIGEIVRAGIQAVPWGQVEASRALGFSGAQTLRMIVLPQALRVILPPLGNQYLNLSKNSSLATAIAFSDTYQVGQTVMNQSGQSIPGFALILGVYLTLSLIISLVMNIVNSRFQLVTR
ncbi:MAG: ABC transporter permease subunit [Phototrophicaceae bacterium]